MILWKSIFEIRYDSLKNSDRIIIFQFFIAGMGGHTYCVMLSICVSSNKMTYPFILFPTFLVYFNGVMFCEFCLINRYCDKLSIVTFVNVLVML